MTPQQSIIEMPLRRFLLLASLVGVVVGAGVAQWVVRMSPGTVGAVAIPSVDEHISSDFLEGIVASKDTIALNAPEQGVVSAIAAIPGMRVAKGTVLVYMEEKEVAQVSGVRSAKAPQALKDWRDALEAMNVHTRSFQEKLERLVSARTLELDRHARVPPLDQQSASIDDAKVRQAQLLLQTSLTAVPKPLRVILLELRSVLRAQSNVSSGRESSGAEEALITSLEERLSQLRSAVERLEIEQTRPRMEQAVAIATTLIADTQRLLSTLEDRISQKSEDNSSDIQRAFGAATGRLLASDRAQLDAIEEDLDRSSKNMLALYRTEDEKAFAVAEEEQKHRERLEEIEAKRVRILKDAERVLGNDRERLQGASIARLWSDNAGGRMDARRELFTIRSPIDGVVAVTRVLPGDAINRYDILAAVESLGQPVWIIQVKAQGQQASLSLGSMVLVHPSKGDTGKGVRGNVVETNAGMSVIQIDPWLSGDFVGLQEGDRVLVRRVSEQ